MFDATRRYVRFREMRADGYVLFEFAIGDPSIFVELILSLPAYQEFCSANTVTFLPGENTGDVETHPSETSDSTLRAVP